jgi:hypothetical protein
MQGIEDIMQQGRVRASPDIHFTGTKIIQRLPNVFAAHNHFHNHISEVWDAVSITNVSIHRNGLYSTLIARL